MTSEDFQNTLQFQSVNPNSIDATNLHQTRHARRLYVGGIPQDYAKEELLINFFNETISQCLDEELGTSYIISVYINVKKYFAFVEFNTIELATACLELDGILYYESSLKIQRADEYKPDLLTPNYRAPIKLNLNNISTITRPTNLTSDLIDTSYATISNILNNQSTTANQLDPRTTIAIFGFPYDECNRDISNRTGCSAGPRMIRKHLCNSGLTASNPEYFCDLDGLNIVDKGDVALGLSLADAYGALTTVVGSSLRKGHIPVVIGGPCDVCYSDAAAVMDVFGSEMAVVCVDSVLNVECMVVFYASCLAITICQGREGPDHRDAPCRMLLEDLAFCPLLPHPSIVMNDHRNDYGLHSLPATTGLPSCDGRLVMFGTQGILSTMEHATFVTERQGIIRWLSKDLRVKQREDSYMSIPIQFLSVLNAIGATTTTTTANNNSDNQTSSSMAPVSSPSSSPISTNNRPICVSIQLRSICSVYCPGVSAPSTIGFSSLEIVHMCYLAGLDPNVKLLDICGFNPEVESVRTGRLIADMIHHFLMGVAERSQSHSHSHNNGNDNYNNNISGFSTSSNHSSSCHSATTTDTTNSTHGINYYGGDEDCPLPEMFHFLGGDEDDGDE